MQEQNNHTTLMRCLQLEDQRRQAQAGTRTWTMQRFVSVGKPLLRRGLCMSGWIVDSVLGRAKSIGSIAEYAAHCNDVDLVSFDVFDTLLYRTVEPPDFLKRRSANYAAHVLTGYALPIHRDLFLFVRAEEEARLRRRALANGGDSECKLSEIIYETVKSLCGADIAEQETKGLVQYELDVECHHLRVAPGAKDLLSALQAEGKRIVAVSDTYLETGHLELIFKRLGIAHYFHAVYSSADHGVGKYSGRLFETVMESERVGRQHWVHVGDNYESDVRAAVRTGLRAVFLRDKARLRRRQQTRRLTAALMSGHVTARSQMANPALRGQAYDRENRDIFVIGRDILGPAFTAFVLRVIEECYWWHVSDIYFLAREGYLLRQIHDLLIRNIYRFRKLTPIPVHYLYVSRLATSLPSLNATEQRNLHLALFRNTDAGLDESLRAFGLTSADVNDIASSYGEGPEATSQLFADPRFVVRVKDLADRARRQLKGYLAQEGFFDGAKVKALVDIGWNATIQANLTRTFYRDLDFPTLVGLYFGRRYAHEEDYALSSRSHFLPGVMFDERRAVSTEHAVDRCVEIFEISASAPHGATVGYRDEGGLIQPELQNLPTRLTREQELLQAGIFAHTEDFSQTYDDHEIDTEVLLRQAARRLRRFICRPTHAEVRALTGVQHSTDWGSQVCRPLIATEISPASVFSPNRLLASLRHCCWPEGTLRHSGIPGGLFFLTVLRRSLRSRQNLRKAARFCASLLRGRSRHTSAAAPSLIPKREIGRNEG